MSESGARQQSGSGVASVTQAVANPAAGVDFTTNPATARQLLAVFATLTTSATVANRLPALRITDNAGHVVASLPASSVQAASLAETYLWAVGNPFSSGQNANLVPLPSGLVIPTNWTVSAVTAGIQATDQWSAIVLTFAG